MNAIEVSDLSVAYRVLTDPTSSLKDYTFRLLKRQVRYERIWALREVTFTVPRGSIFCIIGPNGAGKSTLVKVLGQILPPSTGRVIVRGSSAVLADLGAGFEADLTGKENIVLYGAYLGRDPKLMRRDAEEIAEWAGVSAFLDVPLRAYSSGMLARLGFAIATACEPEVVLVDEVLAVGDETFRRRAVERLERLILHGSTAVVVSHGLDAVVEMANQVMLLESGRISELGAPSTVVAAYRERAEASEGQIERVTS
ncbi:MAG TPA: ATP-binding cassette domain-containing protein [Actinomycetota bacterium]|nr:ATP-binding cassette domain-containing protein [Actinomycetota bacterium]